MAQYDNKEREYKSTPSPKLEFEVEYMRNELAENLQKFKDPVFLGMLMKKVADERENSNRLLKNIFARLDTLEVRMKQLEGVPSGPKPPILLPDVDVDIIEFLRGRGKACAKEIQKKFKYKGTNAACSRLNRLFEQGMLEKKQIGRKVYYFPKEVDVQKA